MKEKELKEFFFTVANYPFSLPHHTNDGISKKMADKYLDGLNRIPSTSNYYNLTRWLIEGLSFRLGRVTPPSGFETSYEKGVSLFSENELVTFAVRRQVLISALDKIVSGLSLAEIYELDTLIIKRAIKLLPQKRLLSKQNNIEVNEFYPFRPSEGDTLLNQPPFLDNVFQFACLSLGSFLMYENLHRIKKCSYCNLFFIAKDTKRKICYEMKCRNEYHKEDMKKRRDKDPVRYC